MPDNMTSRNEFIEPISVIFGDEIVLPRKEFEDGHEFILFAATYTMDGEEYEIYFHALNHEDAEERAEAMRASLVLDGEWGGHFTEEQSN